MAKKDFRLKVVKIIAHQEYDHEIAKYHGRRRWQKEDNKRIRRKRQRRKDKINLRKEWL